MHFELNITGFEQYLMVEMKGGMSANDFSHLMKLLLANPQYRVAPNAIFDFSKVKFSEGKAGAVKVGMRAVAMKDFDVRSNIALVGASSDFEELIGIYRRITGDISQNIQTVATMDDAVKWIGQRIAGTTRNTQKNFDFRICEKEHYTNVVISGTVSISEISAVQQLITSRREVRKHTYFLFDLADAIFTGNTTDVIEFSTEVNSLPNQDMPVNLALVYTSDKMKHFATLYQKIKEDTSNNFSFFKSRFQAVAWMNQQILDASGA